MATLLLRRVLGNTGGAERVFARYLSALGNLDDVIPVTEKVGTTGPSWWRAITYTLAADSVLAAHPGAMSISLDRGPNALIYRAGDGVHRRWRKLVGGVSLNPLHFVIPILERKSLRSAKIVIANSKMVAGELREYYPWVAPKIRVVHNSYDPKKFFVSQEPKGEIRKRLGLPEEGNLFLFMGNGWKRKGLSQALEIVRLFAVSHFPPPTLVVVGKGNRCALGGQPAVYKGIVENMAEYYQACDAFILPTLYDPFTNSVLESLACGTKIVTTRQNGASEVVKHGETGFLMDAQDKNLQEAAEWLASGAVLPPEKIAETVAAYTVDHEIGAIRKIFEEVRPMKEKKLPEIIKQIGFENGWGEKEIWALNIPKETVPIDLISWHFEIPFWDSENGWYDLSPNDVLKNPSKYPDHIRRIEEADTSYAIDICLNPKTGRWTILDGLHRLVKLALHGAKTVEVRKIPFEKVPWENSLEEPLI